MNEQDEQRAREVAKVFISRCPDGLPGEIAGSEEWASRTLTELLAAAFAAVREECAKVAEEYHFQGTVNNRVAANFAGRQIAAAIRGVGEAHGASGKK